MQEPEVNDLSLDIESRAVTADVRIVRNSECCGDEMKEYSFNTEAELDEETSAKIDAILKADPEAEIEVEEGSVDTLEEGGGRYAKSYYGFTLTASIVHAKPTAPRTAEQQAELDKLVSDYATTNASETLRARRAELMAIGRPAKEELGTVELSDKCAASEMDELN